jgi:hypothetical protein
MDGVSLQLTPELREALALLVHAQDFYDLCVVEPESRETGALRDAKVQLREAAYDVVAILRGEQ